MSIKEILDEIAQESGTNNKMKILGKYKDNELLKRVLYLGMSKRIKFYLKQIPEYTPSTEVLISLEDGLKELDKLSSRAITGHQAKTHLKSTLSFLDESDALVVEKIIVKKLNIGMGRTNINKVLGKGFLETTGYQGAQSFSSAKALKLVEKAKKSNQPLFSNVKMDGRYANTIIRVGDIEIESRQGESNLFTGAKFKEELREFDNWVFNGEILLDPKRFNRYESNGIIQSVVDIQKKINERTPEETEKHITKLEKKHNITFEEVLDSTQYVVWDVITVDEYFDKKSDTPYFERFNKVLELTDGLVSVRAVEYKLVYSYQEIMEHFQEMLNRGEEGTVIKAYDGPWKNGKGPHQLKIKKSFTVDLKIVGFNYGTGKNSKVISSLDCVTSDGKLKTSPTGIKESEMFDITNRQDELLNTIIEVKCSGLSWNSNGDFSLMHPVFLHLRDDKDIANTLEEVREIDAMVMSL